MKTLFFYNEKVDQSYAVGKNLAFLIKSRGVGLFIGKRLVRIGKEGNYLDRPRVWKRKFEIYFIK